jgi:cytosine/uracil/thiamine/allantoin permease
MSILLSRSYVVPTWFIVAGLLALSASPIAAAGVLLLCAVVATTAVIITFALRTRPNVLQTTEVQSTAIR